jgi:hypothetical protein
MEAQATQGLLRFFKMIPDVRRDKGVGVQRVKVPSGK